MSTWIPLAGSEWPSWETPQGELKPWTPNTRGQTTAIRRGGLMVGRLVFTVCFWFMRHYSAKSFKSRGLLGQWNYSVWYYNGRYRGFPGGSAVKKPPANSGDTGDLGSIPGSGRYPGGGHGNPLQYSCLENPRDSGAGWATVHGVTKSQTQLSNKVQQQW